jgi:hypothetical protein
MSQKYLDIHFPHQLPPLSFVTWKISQRIASCFIESIKGTLGLKGPFLYIVDLKQAQNKSKSV